MRVANYFYLNQGYLFYRSMPIETVVGNDSINVEIRMVEGPQARVDRVIIKGNDRTHEHVIRRELYTYPGELFSREDIIRSVRELANLGHFDPEKFFLIQLMTIRRQERWISSIVWKKRQMTR